MARRSAASAGSIRGWMAIRRSPQERSAIVTELSGQSSTSGWRSDYRNADPRRRSIPSAVAALAELVHEPRTGGEQTEIGSRLVRSRALVEQQHLGEVVTQAGACLLIRARDGPR